jgi:hypothetical protein
MHGRLQSDAAGADFPLYRPGPEHVRAPRPPIASARGPAVAPIGPSSRDLFHAQDQITPETAPGLADGVDEDIQIEILSLALEAVEVENDALLSPSLHGFHPSGACIDERGEQFLHAGGRSLLDAAGSIDPVKPDDPERGQGETGRKVEAVPRHGICCDHPHVPGIRSAVELRVGV